MKSTIFRASLFVVLLFAAAAAGADWSTWQYDAARRGASPESLQLPLRLGWIQQSPAAPELAWAGPRSERIEGKEMRHRVAFDRAAGVVAADGRVFFGSSVDHQIRCLDAATGKQEWSYFTEGPIRLAPTVWEGKVLVGSDDGCVYCFNAEGGELVWKLRVAPEDERLLARGKMISRWPVRTGVTVEGGIAYFGAGIFPHETVYLAAADADTGEIVWFNDRISQENAGRNDLSPQGYLLAGGDRLFVPSGRSLPAAFDQASGEELFHRTLSWRTTAGGVVGGYKAVYADGQLFASGPHHFLALDQESGAAGHAWLDGRQLVISADKGFVADGRRIAAMDRAEHEAATRERQKLNLELYDLQRSRGSLEAAEYRRREAELSKQIAELGEVGVRWSAPSADDAALILAGDKVFAGGQDHVAAYDADSGEMVWESEVEGLAAELSAANDCLFVSTDQGKIYCFADADQAGGNGKVVSPPAMESPFPKDKLTPVYQAAAEEIVKRTGLSRGFCLIVGSEQGRLAHELAKRTDLRIYGIEPDAEKVAAAREALDRAGLYGTRVTIVHGDPRQLPFSNYFANLIVSDTLLLTGKMPGDAAETGRCLKPCGGMICLHVPADAPGAAAAEDETDLNRALVVMDGNTASVRIKADSKLLTRGKLTDVGEWSHQYGDAANTSLSDDHRVKGGMGVLWYGDPGPAPMVNRHDAAAAPLSTNGRMFIQGTSSILCYDAYNGLFLWEFENPGAIRTGVFNNEETSNLAASDDYLFVAVDDGCTAIDAATGKVVKVHKTPPARDELPRVWGYVASYEGLLLGTSTIRGELEASLRRRGHTVKHATDGIFAVDPKTGEQKWIYRGENILHVTIAVAEGRVFFIDSSISQAERDRLLAEDKEELKALPPEEQKKKEEELKELDVRKAVCLDAATGEKLWETPVDVTNCSYVGIGGGQLTVMVHDGCVVICGANANGHYWRQFLSGQFSERRLVVLSAEDGKKLWAKDANYRHRPIIVEDEIFAEPWAFNIRTGEEKTRQHPLTGEEVKWQFSRPGHHCGMITATPNTLFFRSGVTGYYDLYADEGAGHFAGHRTGCWINVIPGNGLVMIPEASAGCVCQFSIAATVVMEPRADRKSWGIYSAAGAQTPVQHLALNLGGPGDRRDSFDTLWLSWPRPQTVGRLEYDFSLGTTFAKGGDFFTGNSESIEVAGADVPWLFASQAEGLTRLEIPLLGEGDKPARYSVQLHFAELDETAAVGDRVFDVKLQGAAAAEGVDVVKDSGGGRRALTRTFAGIAVDGKLAIELVPRTARGPILSAVEIRRE